MNEEHKMILAPFGPIIVVLIFFGVVIALVAHWETIHIDKACKLEGFKSGEYLTDHSGICYDYFDRGHKVGTDCNLWRDSCLIALFKEKE